MLGSLIGGGLTNSGSMPVSANGGTAGPSNATSDANSTFRGGSFSMGSGSNTTLLVVGAMAVAALYFAVKK